MEESISRMAGSYYGVKLAPEDLVAAAHRARRPAAERTTLYEIRRRYEVPARIAHEEPPALASLDGGPA
jgi:FO synthase